MFDPELYPTPKEVIEKMLEPWKGKAWKGGFNGYQIDGFSKLSGKIILEPSAGSGNILDYITGKFILSTDTRYGNEFHTYSSDDADKNKIYCCERDANLKYLLQGKGYKVISDDFLEYNGDYFFDLILMNPPFSNGDEHLLKAWEILHEGDIVCLLNSETINNPYSKRRQLLKDLIESHGSVEHLGNVFSDSERKTDVNVSLVRLHKAKTKKKFDFEFESVNKEKAFHFDEETIKDAPAFKDIIGNMLLQYDKIKEAFVDYMKVAEQLNYYGRPLISKNEKGEEENQINIFNVAESAYSQGAGKKDAHNIFCSSVKSHMWRIVMANINNISSFDMEKFMTHSVRKNFSEFSARQGDMDFTRENVWNMITMLFENKDTILETAIGEVFDIFTSYHKENRNYVEGWKTNSKWKVNKKIILPNAVRWGSWSSTSDLKKWGGKFDIYYDNRSKYSDIDKTMDYITGGQLIDEVGLYKSLETKFNEIGTVYPGDTFDTTGESSHFKWKFFKKGTLHLEFKDVKLWEEFNLRACYQRNWLPTEEAHEYEARKKKEKNAHQKPEPVKQEMLQLQYDLEEEFQL